MGLHYNMTDKYNHDTVLHIYIGEDDIQEWTQGVGKFVLMPAMFESLKEMINEDLEKIQFARVECSIRNKKRAFDFFVEIEGCLLYTSPSPRDRG